jgi:hypothetical protein
MRIEAIDTFEHITEFGSAADHSLTLQKWQEMGIPISTPEVKDKSFMSSNKKKGGEQSVFEDSIDSTVPSEGGLLNKDDARWKFSGPWLAGLSEGDFNGYLLKEVRRRKPAFQKFLRQACADEVNKETLRKAQEQGTVDELGDPLQASDTTESQLASYVKDLRQDRKLLYRQIRKFLDLPPAPSAPPNAEYITNLMKIRPEPTLNSEDYEPHNSPYANSGPPRTHPSAGLSYGRTSAITFNHPLYGPQNKKPPVQARVVMPKGAATGNFAPVLGVGGFVVDVPAGTGSFNLGSQRNRGSTPAPLTPGLQYIEPNKVGGSKAYVHPRSASVDPKGRVVLKVEQADIEAVAILEGKGDEIPRYEPFHLNQLFEKKVEKGPTSAGVGYGLSSEDLKGRF